MIKLNFPQTSNVTLKIYNIMGEEVTVLLSGPLLSGLHSVTWHAAGMASGVYLFRLEAGDPSTGLGQRYVEMKKMILMK